MEARSNKTKLKDRDLWYDGDSTVTSVTLEKIIASGGGLAGICVDTLNPAIEQFNQVMPEGEKILTKQYMRPLDFAWVIPSNFAELDVRAYLMSKLTAEGRERGWSTTKRQVRWARVERELEMFEKADLFGVIRTLIYIINTLQTHNVVWGVGRGSSVASYVLYLIGVHDVDSVEYRLDIADFLRP